MCGVTPVWVRVPLSPLLEGIRQDEEPSRKDGSGESHWGFESLAFRSRRHGGMVDTLAFQAGSCGFESRWRFFVTIKRL